MWHLLAKRVSQANLVPSSSSQPPAASSTLPPPSAPGASSTPSSTPRAPSISSSVTGSSSSSSSSTPARTAPAVYSTSFKCDEAVFQRTSPHVRKTWEAQPDSDLLSLPEEVQIHIMRMVAARSNADLLQFGATCVQAFSMARNQLDVVHVGVNDIPVSIATGEKLFRSRCTQCHTITKGGAMKQGPNLYGLMGRKSGTLPNYNYTAAMKNANVTWSEDTLFHYLENPKRYIPKCKMAFPGFRRVHDRADVIAYVAKASTSE